MKRRRTAIWALGALSALMIAGPASALTLTFDFADAIVGEDPGFTADVTAIFDFNPACNGTEATPCELGLTLRYNQSGGLDTQGKAFSGILFEPLGGADFQKSGGGNQPIGGLAGAEALVGSGAALAQGELGNIVLAGNAVVNVTSHWALNPSLGLAGVGSVVFSSVGDVFGMNAMVGTPHLLGSNPSSLELNPPDGSLFAIVDDNTVPTAIGFPAGNLAYVQNELRANLYYKGSLNGVNLVQPIFGTEGRPLVPEPSSAALLGFGLLGLMALGRRLRSA